MNKKAIILLSGGLDSLVCLDIAKKRLFELYALFFNYSQKAYLEEKDAVRNICSYYKIEYKEINIPFLSELSDNALVNDKVNNFDSLELVWIPNRNGLFLNIAACYCDKMKIDRIIFGANKKEAIDFPDNSSKFVKKCNDFFEFSTLHKPKLYVPTLEFDKIQIINYAIDNNVPLNLIKSCYQSSKNTNKKHCGYCMSCKLLKEGILKSKNPKLLEEIF